MTTVIDIIKLALKDIKALGIDEILEPELAQDTLTTLNQMIGQWATKKRYVFAQKVVTVVANGSQTYTIGAGGNLNVPLPPRIDAASWDLNGVDTSLYMCGSLEEYERISVKVQQGDPEAIFFQRTYPLGNIYVWPQPSNGTFRFVTRVALTGYSSLTQDMVLPDEYALAVRFSLAELMDPGLSSTISVRIAQMASNARRVMKQNNTEVLELDMPIGVRRLPKYDITTDY